MIENILAKLRKVKKTGPNRWLACCPAHEDKSPSLSIHQRDSGKIDVHCFAQCEGRDVLAAIGMKFVDLYPDRINPPQGLGNRLPFSPYEVLQAVANEAEIVAMAGAKLAAHPLKDSDRQRLFKAVARINAARNLTGVKHGR